ncbi:hypothetical protein QL285_013188 [Trifolium repens]|nr:hypothetical protein QL285_013188 [Trifolium repens]
MKKSVGPSWFLSVSSYSFVFQARENALFSSFSLVAFSLVAVSYCSKQRLRVGSIGEDGIIISHRVIIFPQIGEIERGGMLISYYIYKITPLPQS